ncbi:MAG: tRNA (N(6)-L-threonylcarbamoyladenosine(37)-C(2))-methylthiotransferase MtaB [Kiritimatiellae bacterium]|nr:tRNA (N(6)-L-threonylcarbamoyladenosine(37)-C(2))-methylthiotransferase MtaB [Kiritimatiellia bacterium]
MNAEATPYGAAVSFKTIGCRLNQAETAMLRALLAEAGCRIVRVHQPCDIAIVHGCAVTRNAERDTLRAVRQARRAHPAAFVVLAGCPVEALAPDAFERAGADLLLDQNAKFSVVAELRQRGVLPPTRCPQHPVAPLFENTRALLKVQDGCDFRCAYCIVPAARGPARSRPLDAILRDARRLADRGHREIVLTGANLGCYAHGTANLLDLLAAVEQIPGIDRIRLSSIEISTVERPVIDFMARSAKLCPFLHLPLQSGDDQVLRAMGRRYSPAQYQDVVRYAVEKIPLLGLGADILVGFPAESEEAFAATCRLVRELPFSNLHVFPYSTRPGTAAARLPDAVQPREKKRRAQLLVRLGREKRETFAQRFVGREVRVLLERVDDHGSAAGWTGEYLPARVRRPRTKPGDIVAFTPSRTDGDVLLE